MSKRKYEESPEEETNKKQRKQQGFSVGPANLPDGTYRRKTQKIKNDLIAKAKVRKAYAKIKLNDEDGEDSARYDPYTQTEDPTRPAQSTENQVDGDGLPANQDATSTNEIHPDRQAMLDEPEEIVQNGETPKKRNKAPRKRKIKGDDETNANLSKLGERGSQQRDRNRPVRYHKEFAIAEEKKAQDEARRLAQQQRQKERKAMSKARRPGKDGKQKLGRQSDILLSRVKRLVGQS